MDVAGRFYFEPESGGLLLSPADEHPSEPVDAAAEMEDVAWALEMLAEATTLDARHVRSSWAGLRTFTPDRVPAVGWEPGRAGLLLARRPGWRRDQDRAGDGALLSAAIVGGRRRGRIELAALGVGRR